MYALNNVTTEDEFSDSQTLECPGTNEVNILVSNAAIYVQYAYRRTGFTSDSPVWEPPEGVFFPPGTYVRGRRIEQIRIRSAVTGKPAQVTIEAVG